MPEETSILLRLRGRVQGVGFRPVVFRLAHELGLRGWVRNDAAGAEVALAGPPDAVARFRADLPGRLPAAADIRSVDEQPAPGDLPAGFEIRLSAGTDGARVAGILPDLATCPDCLREILDPADRRFRYPFANCTHCGPRFSILEALPYDREHTTMKAFRMCPVCEAEYRDPRNRRFHAQPNACPVCGPQLTWTDARGAALAARDDALRAAADALKNGQIVAVKGIGGFHLMADARDAAAVRRLRERKQRDEKPFALLFPSRDAVAEACDLSEAEAAWLESPAAPIVLLRKRAGCRGLAEAVAPGLPWIGAMLPYTPLHHLLMRRRRAPIVLTSGNLSDEPQATALEQAASRLAHCADWVLDHDRPIARRVDDSVGRVVAGAFRLLRRARGHAPAPILLPDGFDTRTPVLALGGDLKNTFALVRDGQCVVSQHIGDLHDAECFADWRHALVDYLDYYDFTPARVACDLHPGYLSTQLAEREYASRRVPVAHHHAHIAACLGEHGWPKDGGKVLGIALDGLGMGEDGTLRGGEFLYCDYAECERVGTLKPVALLGADRAAHEPWRNTYAHLMAEMGWARFATNFGELELFRFLDARPRALLDGMLANGTQAPLATSAGRLFDAVAAAIGFCRERVAYEGEAAIRMEAAITDDDLAEDTELDYPFQIPRLDRGAGIDYIEPLAMWQALLGDLILDTPTARIAARFHRGFAHAVVRMALRKRADLGFDTVALSGGVFQNRILAERVIAGLETHGLRVLLPRQLPANDGGLAFGQALVALARNG